MQGAIVACHRLRNKKRVLVKFQDMEDRDAVYQARFEQPQQDTNKVIIHENLTETRANMIKLLGQMREKNAITNYHTKNGAIYARNSRDKRYTLIEPWLSEDDIMRLVQRASQQGTHSIWWSHAIPDPGQHPAGQGGQRGCWPGRVCRAHKATDQTAGWEELKKKLATVHYNC